MHHHRVVYRQLPQRDGLAPSESMTERTESASRKKRIAAGCPAFSPPTCSASGSLAFSRTRMTHASTSALSMAPGSSSLIRSLRISGQGLGPVKSWAGSSGGRASAGPQPAEARSTAAAARSRRGVTPGLPRRSPTAPGAIRPVTRGGEGRDGSAMGLRVAKERERRPGPVREGRRPGIGGDLRGIPSGPSGSAGCGGSLDRRPSGCQCASALPSRHLPVTRSPHLLPGDTITGP